MELIRSMHPLARAWLLDGPLCSYVEAFQALLERGRYAEGSTETALRANNERPSSPAMRSCVNSRAALCLASCSPFISTSSFLLAKRVSRSLLWFNPTAPMNRHVHANSQGRVIEIATFPGNELASPRILNDLSL